MNRHAQSVLPLLGILASLALSLPAQQAESPQQRINQLFQTSYQALNQSELEKAESDTREILGIALDQLGTIYGALRRFDRAELAYQEAIRSSVEGASASLLGLSILYLRTGEYDLGKQTVQQILAINPLHSEAQHTLGKMYFMQGRFADAASQLQDSYRSRRSDVSIAYTLALANLKLRRVEAAAKVFEEMRETLGDSARLRILIGRGYRETGFYEEALGELKAAIELQPDIPRAHHYLGLTYLLLKDASGFPEARVAFEKELELQPDAYFPNFFLGVISTSTRRNREAIEYLQRAIAADPETPDPYLHLGQAWFQEGDFEAASQALTRCLELTTDPTRNNYQIAQAHYTLGRSLLKMGQREQGAEHVRRSQELKKLRSEQQNLRMQAHIQGLPVDLESLDASLEESEEPAAIVLDTPQPDAEAEALLLRTAEFYLAAAGSAYQQMARIMSTRERLPRAMTYLERAFYWQPDTPGVALNLAVARIKNDQAADAVEPLIQTIKRGESQTEARRLLANVALQLVEQRKREPARRAIDFLLEANPEVPELHLMRGHLQAQGGNFNQALIAYRQALALSPRLPEAHFNTGTVLIRLGRLDEALTEFEEELQLNPQHPKALYHKAFVLASRREYEQAAPLLQQVIRLDPDYADAYYQLGKIQLESDQLLLATANLETAAYHSPLDAHVQYQLFRAYTKAGRQQAAQKALERYQALKRAQERQ